jgi:hypothetical protein
MNAGEDDHEDQEGPELDPLGQGARHDRRRGGAEHQLEEEVGGNRGVVERGVRRRKANGSSDGRREQRADPARDRPGVTRIHEVEADEPVHDARDREERDVLRQLRGDVLRPDEAGLEHGEARGHPHDEEAADQEQQRRHDVGADLVEGRRRFDDFLDHLGFLREPHQRQSHEGGRDRNESLKFHVVQSPFSPGRLRARLRWSRPCGRARAFHIEDEDLAVADLVGLGGGRDDVDDLFGHAVRDHDLELHLRHEVHRVLRPAIDLGVAGLRTEALDFRHHHAAHPDGGERLAHLLELERLDRCNDEFHVLHPLPLRGRHGPRLFTREQGGESGSTSRKAVTFG